MCRHRTCRADIRNSTSSKMSSSAHLRGSNPERMGMMPAETISADPVPTPTRLRKVARVTRMTFSFSTVLSTSTNLEIMFTFDATIACAALKTDRGAGEGGTR